MDTRRGFFSKFVSLGSLGAVAACNRSTNRASSETDAKAADDEHMMHETGSTDDSFWSLHSELPRVDEISLHPSELPDSPNYTLYRNGRFEKPMSTQNPKRIEVHWEIKEEIAEIVPGTTLELWTFEGKIPGPMVRARVGDRLDFFLHNSPTNRFTHNVDFHAFTGPDGGAAFLDTRPGATSHLRAKLLHPGVYIYHCAFPPVASHIAHGMYGLVVVEPKQGLPPVDHEYYLLQSEYYTTLGSTEPVSTIQKRGHLAFSTENAMREEPTFVSFNGRPGAVTGKHAVGVLDKPIHAGETIRLFAGNIGPNLSSSFHLIGEIFDRVYLSGSFSTIAEHIQTVLIPAGGAIAVEIKTDVPGSYHLIDHSIFRVSKGALAEIVVQGETNSDIFEPIEYSHVRD